MKKVDAALYVVFFVFAVFFSITGFVPLKIPLNYLIKTVPIFCLLILVIRILKHPIKIYLILALSFSAAGDIILGISLNEYFILGLICFLIVHIIYIPAFLEDFKFNKKSISIIALILLYTTALVILFKDIEGSFLIPFMVYLFIITVMTISACLHSMGHYYNEAKLIFIGAVFFMVSDTLIAVDKFLYSIPQNNLIAIIPYYTAQFLILHGFIKKQKAASATTGSAASN